LGRKPLPRHVRAAQSIAGALCSVMPNPLPAPRSIT
jgi:hypothetical protein